MKRLGVMAAVGALVGVVCFGAQAGIAPGSVKLYLWLGVGLGAMMVSSAAKEGVSWWQGDPGERRVIKGLESLSDDYTVVTNHIIPNTKQGDLDLLVLGPHGVLVVEVKAYCARYACDGDKWVNIKENGYRKPMKSPSLQLKRNASALEKHLKREGCPATVQMVLCINRRADVQVKSPTVPMTSYGELSEYVRSLPAGGRVVPQMLGIAG